MTSIATNLARVRERITAACRAAGRPDSDVRLVAVSKKFPASAVREAAALGQAAFGENRFQDAEPKLRELEDLKLRWHFLGQIQTNKLNRILERFDVIESMDRLEVLEKAEGFLAGKGWSRDALLEIHISGEATKAGFDVSEFEVLLRSGALKKYTHLRLRGLMGIAPHTPDRAAVRASFELLKKLYDAGRASGLAWDTLSMGMSADLEEAIAAGSTEVRIGTSVFGSRSV